MLNLINITITLSNVIKYCVPQQVQTNFQMVTDNQFVTTVEDADNINHLVIFLTGTQPFPDGFGGSGIFSKYNIISNSY